MTGTDTVLRIKIGGGAGAELSVINLIRCWEPLPDEKLSRLSSMDSQECVILTVKTTDYGHPMKE